MATDILKQIANCIEQGKIDAKTPYPPQLKDQDGADEWTKRALESGISASEILEQALVPAMGVVGARFRDKLLFVPQVLMAAKAMNTAMSYLKPYFLSGAIRKKGTVIIGTVAGDLHDIGKNLVSMMIEGAGWNLIDLGVDVKTHSFVEAIEQNPNVILALSALLTTTMTAMEQTVKTIKEANPSQIIMIGGAPVSQAFCDQIGADFYSSGPQGAVEYLSSLQDMTSKT